jgi:5-oxoprolinase (ATP-hydrolysing)
MNRWSFTADRGGTFTDVIGVDPNGCFHTTKLLSSSPEYSDASIEGIRRILGTTGPLPADQIETIRFGTTVATNALLERKGRKAALFITAGFRDLLEIGHQARPDLFALSVQKNPPLYDDAYEVFERVDADGNLLTPLDERRLKAMAQDALSRGYTSAAVVLMHSWRNSEHEKRCKTLLLDAGLSDVYLSHETMNLIKIVSRGQTCLVDAYLGPVLGDYLASIRSETQGIDIEFMESAGSLSPPEAFTGKDALLSGPAGGAQAVAELAEELGLNGAIGFDMGGTSTDVTRFDGAFEKRYDHEMAGVSLQKEMIAIHTVAAGGGSILTYGSGRLQVGPESAGSYPGPASYGFGGPLTITDANVMTGRICADFFPETFGDDRSSPLNSLVVEEKFQHLAESLDNDTTKPSLQELAAGFLRITDEKMALAIREISLSKGYDLRNYALVCFGGAGGQHVCPVARLLGINEAIIHPLSGLMSAYGIGLSVPSVRSAQTVLMPFTPENLSTLHHRFDQEQTRLSAQRNYGDNVTAIKSIDLRPVGADKALTVPFGSFDETLLHFQKKYRQLFGFHPAESTLEVVNLRLTLQADDSLFPSYQTPSPSQGEGWDGGKEPQPERMHTFAYGDGTLCKGPLYRREALPVGMQISGPAVIIDPYVTLIIDPDFNAHIEAGGIIRLKRIDKISSTEEKQETIDHEPDPVQLEIFNNLFSSVATEMGHLLSNTAHSVNIKERLDFSCDLFDAKGDLVANAPHIPVHLGAMSETIKALIEDLGNTLKDGQVYMANNPYRGGSHLPDITVMSPHFHNSELCFFTAARGHHADIGGKTAGSMPPEATHISDEGILIDAMLIAEEGRFLDDAALCTLNSTDFPARNLAERLADLKAQVAACSRGAIELERILDSYGWPMVNRYMGYIQDNSEQAVRRALASFLEGEQQITRQFEDRLDDGTIITVKLTIQADDSEAQSASTTIDFTGTGPVHFSDNLNAPAAVTRSAVLYVMRCLTGLDIPLNSGCLKPVTIISESGTLINPEYPAPVASGNVETSQRIVDVLLGAFGVAAASQGTMNNLLFQSDGGAPYYETIAGGAGATAESDGASGVQVHMTNTRITDPEILESRYRHVRLERFEFRRGSGGKGEKRGGDGVIRQIRFLKPASVSLLSERRSYAPYGMAGGASGQKGRNSLIKKDGSKVELPSRIQLQMETGDLLSIETPGGGGFGKNSSTK